MQFSAACSAAVLFFQFASAPGQRPQTPKATIEGVVLRAGTGQPVAAAQVTVIRQGRPAGPAAFSGTPLPPGTRAAPPAATPPPAASTDDNGKFALQNLDEGSYTLQIQGNGYVPQAYGQRYTGGPGTPIVLTAGQIVKDVAVTLTPAGNISGRIRDASSQPLVSIPVQLLRLSYNATAQRTFQSAGLVRTDDRGEYRLYWITPGRYYLRAGNPTNGGESSVAMMMSAMLKGTGANGNMVPSLSGYSFYPGVTDIDSARPIEVQVGAELQGVDLTIVSKPRTHRISGRVIDSRTGQPPANANVVALPQMPGLDSSGFDAATIEISSDIPGHNYDRQTGTFEIRNLLPGPYAIKASILEPGGGRPSSSGIATVSIADSDVEGVAVTVFPAATIPGQLHLDGQLPQGINLDRTGLVFTTPSERANGSSVFLQGRLNADGTFRLNDVSPGEYRFRIQPDFGVLYVKEARFEGVDILNMPFRFSGSVSGTLDIVAGTTRGSISGVLMDSRSQTAPGTRVVLVPNARQRIELYKVGASDENGRFTFSAIAPGDYKVFSWDDIDEYAWFDTGLLAQSETKGRPVHVTETSTETVEVRIIPKGDTR
jgi:hypothetical protein